jgi:hypothetical protein
VSGHCWVSIIIINYNYARFIRQAIESALSQTHENTEVLVVDDGSTDGSRRIISEYGDRVRPIFKENGGMGSGWNAGFAASHGEVVMFLDSDDFLLPGAAEHAAQLFRDQKVAKVHWPLWEIDQYGMRTGRVIPPPPLPEGDFREATLRIGPDSYTSPPTTGNAWARWFAQQVLPMPEEQFRRHSDTYLYTLAPIFGTVRAIQEPQACYRIHGNNDYAGRPAEEKNRRNLEIFDRRCQALSKQLRKAGTTADPEAWKQRNSYYGWMQKMDRAVEELKALIPTGATFVLVDDSQWSDGHAGSEVIAGRRALPFLERNGQYWGSPPDDATAVVELERMRHEGAAFVVFAWPTFWWLQHYTEFARHLRECYQCRIENERVVVFALSGTSGNTEALASLSTTTTTHDSCAKR